MLRIALTHNQRIRYTPNELAAVKQHGVALLVMIGKVAFPELAKNFVNTLSAIEIFLEENQPPFIAKVYRPPQGELERNPGARGSVKLWYSQS